MCRRAVFLSSGTERRFFSEVFMKKRALRLAVIYLAVVAGGVLYGLFVSYTGWGIPCIINFTTGFNCPGCGITRFFANFLRGDFHAAIMSNMLAPLLCAYFAAVLGECSYRYIKSGSYSTGKASKIASFIIVLPVIIWTVIRNIYKI